MPSIMGNYPAVVDGIFDFAFNPGTSVADTSSTAFIRPWRTPVFNRSHALGVADVAKNYFSYAHEISGWK
jgi:hypothetical protein